MTLSAAAERVMALLHGAGYEAFAVGGCVRDALLGREIHDFDICTSALPEQMARCFEDLRVIPTGLAHGTLTVLCEGEAVEVTTFRCDGAYTDHRHPQQVSFVPDVELDLARRDFTVNAMAWNAERGLIDPFGGRQDLQNKVLRCVGDPMARFEEDALRVLRALRFAARFDLAVEPTTARAMHAAAPLLRRISGERILQELRGLLAAPDPEKVLLDFADVMAVIVPELADAVGFAQNSRYHCYDVYTHCVKAACAVPSEPPVRLALLLHDCAKPQCYTEENGVGHFYGHATKSEQAAHEVLTRLHADNACIKRVCALIHWHDVPLKAEPAAVRRLLQRLGTQGLHQLLQVKKGDALAHHPDHQSERLQQIGRVRQLMQQILQAPVCLSVRDLAIGGEDLRALGMAAGPAMGRLLRRLLDAVIEGALPNEREALLDAAKKENNG